MNDAKYIGSDVHQAMISVVVLDCTGHLMMESIIETKAANIVQLIHGLRGSLHVAFEEGTCAAWLHDLLKPPSCAGSQTAGAIRQGVNPRFSPRNEGPQALRSSPSVCVSLLSNSGQSRFEVAELVGLCPNHLVPPSHYF
jgi:hypothetical protein